MREEDIRPLELFEEYLRLSAKDVKQYFPSSSKRHHCPCPGCGEIASSDCYTKNDFKIVECKICQTLYVNPRPSGSALAEFYTNSISQKYWANTFFPSVSNARRLKIFRPRALKIKNLIAKNSIVVDKIVDVGAGAGIMIEELRTFGINAKFQAIEPTPELAAVCRSLDIETYEGFSDAASKDDFMREKSSLVISFEVIEHVTSPKAFLNDLSALAAPGGYILFTGLCRSGFDIQLLGQNSKSISPPHHLNFLSRKGVSALLKRCGLKEITFTTPGILDVDIVRNTLKADKNAISNTFFKELFCDDDAIVLNNLQKFITENNLSSHMWVLAQK